MVFESSRCCRWIIADQQVNNPAMFFQGGRICLNPEMLVKHLINFDGQLILNYDSLQPIICVTGNQASVQVVFQTFKYW